MHPNPFGHGEKTPEAIWKEKQGIEKSFMTNPNQAKQLAERIAREIRSQLERELAEQVQNNGKWLGYLCRICAELNLPLETDGDALVKHVAQLRATNAELQKDKERLDWLEENKGSLKLEVCYTGEPMHRICISHYKDGIWYRRSFGNSFRTAIDNAKK